MCMFLVRNLVTATTTTAAATATATTTTATSTSTTTNTTTRDIRATSGCIYNRLFSRLSKVYS